MNKGALEIDTNKYILPQYALPKVNYRCFDATCNRFVIKIKQSKTGAITHFRHLKVDGGEDCVCERYSLNRILTADEIHKDAILNLKYILENDRISKRVIRCCPSCGINLIIDKEIDNLEQNECIKTEYTFKHYGRNLRADIVRLFDGKLTQIYEIKNTHSTKEEDRPTDIEWYEIDAKDINEQISKMMKEDDREIKLECLRQTQLCPSCFRTKEENERWEREEQERCNAIKKKQLEQQELERYNAVKQEQKGWNSNWYNKEYGIKNQQLKQQEIERLEKLKLIELENQMRELLGEKKYNKWKKDEQKKQKAIAKYGETAYYLALKQKEINNQLKLLKKADKNIQKQKLI